MQKVFGIGFHKTGTTSLDRALTLLGYRVTGPNAVHDPDISQKIHDFTQEISKKFDAFQDNPWPLVYREMDNLYPNAKFTLTVRDPDEWILSMCKHFGEQVTPMRQLIYGSDFGHPLGNELHYKKVMLTHNKNVRTYFSDRPDKLLEIDFSSGQGWEPLCRFLGHPEPSASFPHANKAADRDARKGGAPRFMKRIRRAAARIGLS